MAGLTDNTLYGFGWNPTYPDTSITEPPPPPTVPEVIKPPQPPQPPQPPEPGPDITTPDPEPGGGSGTPSVLEVSSVDFQIMKNAKLHHTDEFHCVREQGRPVIRRGQLARWVLQCRKAYDPSKHDIRIRMDFSWKNNTWPTETNGTRAIFAVQDQNARLTSDTFGAKLVGASGNRLELDVMVPHNCCIGNWTCYVLTNSKGNYSDTQSTQASPKICILFNAWCPGDTVFLDNEELRKEYVLRDYGELYTDSWYKIGTRSWNFAQFEQDILDSVFKALQITGLRDQECGNSIQVVRNLTSGLNWLDNSGVLFGKWASNNAEYYPYTPPWQWRGSEKIFQSWYRTGQPTRYGQCWVFSAITTTALRALGVPARSVTTFRSAHDTNKNCTIQYNKYWGWKKKEEKWGWIYFQDEKLLGHLDSVWNFHCWNDCWMKRPDLPKGYDGWQAVDSTPQERSGGLFKCGPTSLTAIKQGDISLQYDTAFVWAEVDSDQVHTIFDRNTWEKIRVDYVDKKDTGKLLSTKQPGGMYAGREDITHLYKYPEMSREERAVVTKVQAALGHPPDYTHRRMAAKPDVNFELQDRDHVLIGQTISIYLEVKNMSDNHRTVDVQLNLYTSYYTGSVSRLVKKENLLVKLEPKKVTECVIRATPEEYLNLLVDQGTFKVTVLASVNETEQVFTASDGFNVLMPTITIQAHPPYEVNKPFLVEFTLQNPLPKIVLHNCAFTIQGAGLEREREIACSDVPPGGEAKIVTQVIPSRPGTRVLIAGFSSKEVVDADGNLSIDVMA